MKKGDIIRCHDQKDLRQTMKDLSAAGFNAVKDSGDNFASVSPECRRRSIWSKQGIIMERCSARTATRWKRPGRSRQSRNGYEFVEIMKGYAGEWESIAQSW